MRNIRLISEIVNTLPDCVETILLSNDRELSRQCSNLCQGRKIICLDVPPDTLISVWAQDPYLVLHGKNRNSFLASKTFLRADDHSIPSQLSKHLGWHVINSFLEFEGGNIVADQDVIYVGADMIQQNAMLLQASVDTVLQRFERETGRPVVMIGPYPQPVGHIDLILTPLGNQTLVLADPMEGARMAEQALSESPASVEKVERHFEQTFFSDGAGHMLMDDGSILASPGIRGRTRQAVNDSKALAPVLDRLAEVLEKTGFKVFRVPFLYRASAATRSAHSPQNTESTGSDPRHGAEYPCFSYNNVLLDGSPGIGNSVYIPRYGWPLLDEAARKKWSDIGYEPQFIDGFAVPSIFGGSLRCMTKVLKRSPGLSSAGTAL